METAELLGKIGSDKAVEPLILALKDSNDEVRMEAAEALVKIGSDKAVEPLILALKDSDDGVRWNAAEALVKIAEVDRNLPTLTQQLPHLLTLIPTESSQEALSVITAIQARCKYYNYDIAQTPLPEVDTSCIDSSGNRVIRVEVAEGGTVEQLVIGDYNVKGNQIREQKNYNPPLQ